MSILFKSGLHNSKGNCIKNFSRVRHLNKALCNCNPYQTLSATFLCDVSFPEKVTIRGLNFLSTSVVRCVKTQEKANKKPSRQQQKLSGRKDFPPCVREIVVLEKVTFLELFFLIANQFNQLSSTIFFNYFKNYSTRQLHFLNTMGLCRVYALNSNLPLN